MVAPFVVAPFVVAPFVVAPFVVAIEGEDRADVGAQVAQELESVLLRGGPGLLVRSDDAGRPRLEPQPGDQGRPPASVPFVLEFLDVGIEGRAFLLDQHPGCAPVAQGSGGPRIAVLRGSLVWAVLRQLQPDDVVGAALVQRRLLVGVDDIVGGRQGRGEVGDDVGPVAQAAKGAQVSHGRARGR